MIITCPSCSKRYLVEDNSIDPAGRQVQCVACNHLWFFKPVPGARDLNQVHLDLIGVQSSSAKGATKTMNIGWLLLTITLIATVVGLFAARHSVMQLWPTTQILYKAIGLGDFTSQEGLQFENLRPMIVPTKNGQKVLLTGTIINESKDVREVNRLTITVKGDCTAATWWERFITVTIKHEKPDQCALEKWVYDPSEAKIYPGERVSFETSSTKFLKGAKSIQVQF